ncbi:BhlA/UviB family holin-like peptide [Paenibacillus thailandensis]|uniref:BhlA/UviB family holin-like peptide n=1 Tax=Paenibacillus thailandensis TaxID=393250 RepID=A0ABW5R2T7_9BACL
MESEILRYFLTQGPFAVLFIWLLFSSRKEARERENKLHDILDKFSEKYDLIVGEIRDIKERFKGKE